MDQGCQRSFPIVRRCQLRVAIKYGLDEVVMLATARLTLNVTRCIATCGHKAGQRHGKRRKLGRRVAVRRHSINREHIWTQLQARGAQWRRRLS